MRATATLLVLLSGSAQAAQCLSYGGAVEITGKLSRHTFPEHPDTKASPTAMLKQHTSSSLPSGLFALPRAAQMTTSQQRKASQGCSSYFQRAIQPMPTIFFVPCSATVFSAPASCSIQYQATTTRQCFSARPSAARSNQAFNATARKRAAR